MKKSEYLPYLRTLRRVPDDVILSVATRDMDMRFGDSCLCGWFVKETIGRMIGVAPEDVDPYMDGDVDGYTPRERAETLFGIGASREEWSNLYNDAATKTELVERAFVERVMEAVS